jgi:hypothetical protein
VSSICQKSAGVVFVIVPGEGKKTSLIEILSIFTVSVMLKITAPAP